MASAPAWNSPEAQAALDRIRATREHSETDRRAIAEARDLQRQMNRAMPYALGPRMKNLAAKLHYWRAKGFPADLHWFLGEYREAILSELRSAALRMPRVDLELAA